MLNLQNYLHIKTKNCVQTVDLENNQISNLDNNYLTTSLIYNNT